MRKKMYLFSEVVMVLLLCLPVALSAQSLPVQGVVTSAKKGKPLSGVEVQIKGTKKKVSSNKEGRYEIAVERNFFTPSPASILIFSHKGFITQEVEVIDDRELDVALLPESKEDENIFYTGTAQGTTMLGLPFAGDNLEGQLWLNQVPGTNITNSLQGKVPGLTVTQGGFQPGENAYLQLRAANTLSNGQQPLIILDGIYLADARLADFNADDIERVEILKGAAAGALYGAQGGNGVIQIFTRDGSQLGIGETRITYRGEYGYSEPASEYSLNEFTNRMIVEPNGPQPILGDVNIDQIFDTPLPNLKNYQNDLLFQNGAFNSHYLSMEGKSSSTHFMVAAQRLRDEGIIQGLDGWTRHSLRANLDHQAGKRLHLSFRSAYSNQERDALPLMANEHTSYLNSVLSLTPIFDLDAPNEENASPYDWDIDNTGGNITNPLYLRDNIEQTSRRNRLVGDFDATFEVTPWLSLDYCATLDHINNQYTHFIEKGYLSTSIPAPFSPLAFAATPVSNGGAIQQNTSLRNYFTSTAGFRLQRKWLGLSTNIRGGLLYENDNYTFNGASGENLAVEGIQSLDNPTSNILISSDEQQMIGYNAFLVADANYSDKFFFSGAYRQEQSSLYGEEVGWPGFYRLGAAYRISEDLRIKLFDELKFHAAMGTAGIRPAFHQRFETFSLINGTLTKQTLGNPDLLPARTSEIEVGISATLFKAFSIQANYAQVTTDDQIVFMPLSAGAGFEGQWRNAGTVEADVYEASLNIDVAKLMKQKGKNFNWDITANGQKISQTITSLGVPGYQTGPGLPNSDIFLMEEGVSPGAMVGEVFATSIEEIADQIEIPVTELTINELGYIVNQNDLGTPNERPYKVLDESGNPAIQPIGDATPDFSIGIANRLSYRGLQLYGLLDWKIGGDIYNYAKQQLYGNERHADLSANDNIAAPFYSTALYNNGVANKHFVEDGSFLMLREASLSYTFDKKQLSFLGDTFESIRLSIIGRNLFTITDYSGYHPDVSSALQGADILSSRQSGGLGSNNFNPGGDPSIFAIDGFGYPARRSFTFSLQVQL